MLKGKGRGKKTISAARSCSPATLHLVSAPPSSRSTVLRPAKRRSSEPSKEIDRQRTRVSGTSLPQVEDPDDEEIESEPDVVDIDDLDEDSVPVQSKRPASGNRNPEYARIWNANYPEIGSKIEVFDSIPNEFESDKVSGLKSPYDAFRLFLPDEFIDLQGQC